MLKRTYGQGGEGYRSMPTSGTTPVVLGIFSIANFDALGAQLITDAAGTGAWKVEVSNDYEQGEAGGPPYGQVPGQTTAALAAAAAHWSDITSGFSPAIAAVAAASSQAIQLNVGFRTIRFTYTPATGTANAILIFFAKSFS